MLSSNAGGSLVRGGGLWSITEYYLMMREIRGKVYPEIKSKIA
jgi:hypothetical protein